LVIDYVERENTAAFAYIYCEYSRRGEQTQVALLSSLLQQLLQCSTGSILPGAVTTMYETHTKHSTRPALAEITHTLQDLVAKHPAFYVVVDALDECATSDEDALTFISTLRALGPGVRLLCTSRFSTTFESYFSMAEKLEISAHGEDIAMFLESQMRQQTMLARNIGGDAKLKEEIADTIIGESHGM
jgi:DNA invertase Pin-like site-specific DNA recombinase